MNVMPIPLLHGLSALAALLPACLFIVRGGQRVFVFWALLSVAVAGPASWIAVQAAQDWPSGFSGALWLTIAATLLVFAGVAGATKAGWRLGAVLLPYLVLLGIMAVIWNEPAGQPLTGTAEAAWLAAHIVVSVITYALITLGAIAGLAVILQERALKAKKPTALTRLLPAAADAERLEVGLLLAGEIVLGLGLITGMATLYTSSGDLITIDHKTIFAVLAFAAIGLLLILNRFAGMRGRKASRFVLVGYLLITLAYPGVKFVSDVLTV